ncbi:MAG TPA: hypothetical protein VIV60_23500 [Polyangiaceae bacterium]
MNARFKRILHAMPYAQTTALPLLLISFSACHAEHARLDAAEVAGGANASQTADHAPTELEAALDAVNASAANQNTLVQLSTDGFMQWYQSVRMSSFVRDERQLFDDNLLLQRLPSGYTLTLDAYGPVAGSGPRVYLTGSSGLNRMVFLGTNYYTWEFAYLSDLERTPTLTAEEIFLGSPLPSGESGRFPKSVPVSITEIKLTTTIAGNSASFDALRIEFVINATNMADLIDYFSTAYSKTRVQERVDALLGGAQETHILLEQLLEGWPGQWANHFPSEKAYADGASANDVCHGVARQFFRDSLDNSGQDRSTEASEWLLKTFYVVQDESVDPSFGDYLYLPFKHSIRFMLKDPASSRWIGFSSWSSSFTPYRFWWVDQDYAPPSSETVPIHADFPSSFDVWRRIHRSPL